MLWLLVGVVYLRTGLRFRGAAGRDRFDRLSERRALQVHELFASKTRLFTSAVGLSSCALGLFFGAVLGSVPGMVLYGAAGLLLALAAAVSRRTSASIAAAAAERGLALSHRRESSAKRDRRQLQFGVVAVVGNAVAQIARFFGARSHQPGLMALGATALIVAFGALGALLWSTAWVFGDEQTK